MLQMKPKKIPEEVKNHFEKYWKLSIKFFEGSDFALASFFAITLMEEVGKLTMMRFDPSKKQLKKAGFYLHNKKYIFAVSDNLSVNSRVERIYDKDLQKFIEWVKKDKIFKIRNNSLYLESNLVVPEKAIPKDVAFLLVCFAGEIYAEIQGFSVGTGPEEWQKILDEVDEFREKNK